MKKAITIALATAGLASGAFAQGSVTQVGNLGFYTLGPVDANPEPLTGDVSLELYFAASGSVSTSQINDLNGVASTPYDGAFQALAGALADGFTLVSATTLTGSTAGSLNYTVTDGTVASGPNTIGLLAPVPTDGSGWLALYAVTDFGGLDSACFLAWSQANLGGNPTTSPPGVPAVLTVPGGDVIFYVPEPGTLTLAALGGASLFLLRRRVGLTHRI
jgi:hypothetical protein